MFNKVPTSTIEEVLEHIERVCVVLLTAFMRFKTLLAMSVIYFAFLLKNKY